MINLTTNEIRMFAGARKVTRKKNMSRQQLEIKLTSPSAPTSTRRPKKVTPTPVPRLENITPNLKNPIPP